MSNGNTNSTVDAYKSIIDFNKTIITIASSVLTVLIAYIIYQSIDLKIQNYLSISLIVLAIFLSLFSFGGAIQTVKDGTSRKGTILTTNLSAFFLIGGIVLTLFAFKHRQEKSIDEILDKIEKSTTTLSIQLYPKTIKYLVYENEKYTLIYQADSIEHTVVYSVKTDNIVTIK